MAVKVIDKLKLDQATRMQMLQVKHPDLNEEFDIAWLGMASLACRRMKELGIPRLCALC